MPVDLMRSKFIVSRALPVCWHVCLGGVYQLCLKDECVASVMTVRMFVRGYRCALCRRSLLWGDLVLTRSDSPQKMRLAVPEGCVWPRATWKLRRENRGRGLSDKSVHTSFAGLTEHSIHGWRRRPSGPSRSERFAFSFCGESSFLSGQRTVPRDTLLHLHWGGDSAGVQGSSALPAAEPGLN